MKLYFNIFVFIIFNTLLYGQDFIVFKNFNNLNIFNLQDKSLIYSKDCTNVEDFFIAQGKVFSLISSHYQGKPLCFNGDYYYNNLAFSDLNNPENKFITFHNIYNKEIDRFYINQNENLLLLKIVQEKFPQSKYIIYSIDSSKFKELEILNNKYVIGWKNSEEIFLSDDLGLGAYNIKSKKIKRFNNIFTGIEPIDFTLIDSVTFLCQIKDTITGAILLNKYSIDGFSNNIFSYRKEIEYTLSENKKFIYILNYEDKNSRIFYLSKYNLKGDLINKRNLNDLFNLYNLAKFSLSRGLYDKKLLLGFDNILSEEESGIYTLEDDDSNILHKKLLLQRNLSLEVLIKHVTIYYCDRCY